MDPSKSSQPLIMRLFHVRTKPGRAPELLKNFATKSADVVQHEPGNQGYFFGQGIGEDNVVVFASFWIDLKSIKKRFGSDWQVSFLPEGYEELIDDCWLEHIDLETGWFVRPGDPV